MGTITLPKLDKWAQGSIFIETGSMEGWTLRTARHYGFSHMHGIELNEDYYKYSINLLKNYPNITLWLGESPEILSDLCPFLKEQATFWLDAHASGEYIAGGKYGRCPLIYELEAIKRSPRNDHVIMIDDVRLFNTPEWDNLSIDPVLDLIYSINKDYTITYIDGEDDGQFPNDILVAYMVTK